MPRVLVVDDSLEAGKLLVRLLKHFGIDAGLVTSGQAAMDFLQVNLPGLVILDVMMPGLNGFDVLKLVRADPKLHALPVVMWSALSDAESRQEAMRLGASDYIVKGGTDFDELRAIVERQIGTAS